MNLQKAENSYINLYLSFNKDSEEKKTKNNIKIDDYINNTINKDRRYIIPKISSSDNNNNKLTFSNKNERKSIKISNIPDKIEREDIIEVFKQFGEIKYVNIIYTDRQTKTINKGFAFIEFYDLNSCIKAINHKKIKYEHSIIDILQT